MNYRDAKRLACKLASETMGTVLPEPLFGAETPEDYDRLARAWDELAQELFERGLTPAQKEQQ